MKRCSTIACALLLVGCYLAHEREPSCATTTHGSIAPCSRWEPASPPVLVSEMPFPDEGLSLTSAVVSGCGVVADWYTFSGTPLPNMLGFETRAIDWDGNALGAVLAHPALTVMSVGSGSMELVPRGDGLGAIVNSNPGGCRFLALDAMGADRGAPVSLDVPGCLAMEATDDGFSMLAASTGAPRLVRMGPDGSGPTSTALDVPAGRALWSRTRFEDGSFLLSTFREDPITAVYSGWLEHFDVRGASLAPEVEVGVNGVPVQVVLTSAGALSAWETAEPGGLPMQTRAIDRNGRATGATRDLPAEGAQYGLALTAASDGGAIALWLEDHFDEDPDWRLRLLALDPSGAPRGEPTLLIASTETSDMQLLVDASGERALVLYGDAGVRALPLICAR